MSRKTAVSEAHRKVAKDSELSTSFKIRELHRRGLDRTQIKTLLNKRYQHVRNVLVSPYPKGEKGGA